MRVVNRLAMSSREGAASLATANTYNSDHDDLEAAINGGPIMTTGRRPSLT